MTGGRLWRWAGFIDGCSSYSIIWMKMEEGGMKVRKQKKNASEAEVLPDLRLNVQYEAFLGIRNCTAPRMP